MADRCTIHLASGEKFEITASAARAAAIISADPIGRGSAFRDLTAEGVVLLVNPDQVTHITER